MSGNRSRRKGKRGEAEARDTLTERGFEVIDLTDGTAVCDFLARKSGRTYFCEVKHCRTIELEKFEQQARRQAGKNRWMVLARLPGRPYQFLVTKSDTRDAFVWRGNAAKEG